MTKEQLLVEAIALDIADRESLAEELLVSVYGVDREAIDAAWVDECDHRLAAYDRGEVKPSPVDPMFRRLQQHYQAKTGDSSAGNK